MTSLSLLSLVLAMVLLFFSFVVRPGAFSDCGGAAALYLLVDSSNRRPINSIKKSEIKSCISCNLLRSMMSLKFETESE